MKTARRAVMRLLCAAGIAIVGLFLSGGPAGPPIALGQHAARLAQPGLAEALREAPALRVEKVMDGPTTVWEPDFFWVPNRDGTSWDVLFFYEPKYAGPHELFVLDLGSGKLTRQEVPEGFMFHLVQHLNIDGKEYFKTGVLRRGEDAVWVYDPDANALSFGGRTPGKGIDHGESGGGAQWALGEDGMLYGIGRVHAEGKMAAFRIDPKTLESEVFPPFGDAQEDLKWLYSATTMDGDWVYLEIGRSPWRLWGYNVRTREGKLLAETQPVIGDRNTIIWRPLEAGGFLVTVQQPRDDGRAAVEYWLRDGQLSEKIGDAPPWSDKPLAFKTGRKGPSAPRPQLRRTSPDKDGNVEVTWRPAGHPDAEWNRVTYQVKRYPVPIRRMAALDDGRLFALGESYGTAVMLEPRTTDRTPLGETMSVYSMVEHDGLIYMSGYAGGQVWVYDPAKPWTRDAAPLEIVTDSANNPKPEESAELGTNPLLVTRLQKYTNLQNPWGGTVVGADGRVYAAGWIIRIGNGGALGWWDPRTKDSGGLTDPFSAYPIYWMAGVAGGDARAENRYLAISTKTAPDDKNPSFRPDRGKLFIYDTLEHRIVHELEPPAGAGTPGPVVGSGPGVAMGYTAGPNGEGGVLWCLDVQRGEVLWTKPLPVPPVTAFRFMRRNSGTILHRSPDGQIWTFLEKVLVRIRPTDGHVQVVGLLTDGEIGQLAFAGGEVYLAGDVKLRRIHLPPDATATGSTATERR